MIRRVLAGESYSSIAKSLGCNHRTVTYHCRKAGITSRHKKIGADRSETITVRIRGEDLTLAQVRAKYGIAWSTLYWRWKHGWQGEDLIKPAINAGKPYYELGLSEEEWILWADVAREIGCENARRKSGIPFAALHAAVKGEWHRLG